MPGVVVGIAVGPDGVRAVRSDAPSQCEHWPAAIGWDKGWTLRERVVTAIGVMHIRIKQGPNHIECTSVACTPAQADELKLDPHLRQFGNLTYAEPEAAFWAGIRAAAELPPNTSILLMDISDSAVRAWRTTAAAATGQIIGRSALDDDSDVRAAAVSLAEDAIRTGTVDEIIVLGDPARTSTVATELKTQTQLPVRTDAEFGTFVARGATLVVGQAAPAESSGPRHAAKHAKPAKRRSWRR
ncbi:hypothetical protein [Smaragdicoccus niigatensis]|uniref:hypothetical protein n=1 Tax=Smaragdicoccus niigatensis TaxID=359359 RepID=UPI000477CA49|nr:hypothetical protein [Smaragdicoccus niigatensis]